MIAVLATLLLPIMPLEGSAKWDIAGMTPTRPAISYYEKGKPSFVLTCSGTQTTVQVRGFTAAQKWPQPALSLKFGTATRYANPDLRMIGDQTAFEFQFAISDAVLLALKNGAPLVATYNGNSRTFPVAPAAFRQEFAEKCSALVPPAMRVG
jgi:hypothetical protein